MTFLKLYLLSLPIFLAIDAIWLGFIAPKFYEQQIGHLLRSPVNWPAAAVFYALFLVGVVIFVVQPALAKQSLWHACMYGALFGLITYATYDLTNLAVLKDWTLTVTVVDMAWGAVLTTVVSGTTYYIAQKLSITL